MKTQDRIKDIIKLGIFNDTEIENLNEENTFKSWEYYLIVHLTNEELYYSDMDQYETSDLTENTEKGVIYCFS